MRRRFANSVNEGNHEYRQERIEEGYFSGYVCYIKMKDVKKPFIVRDGDFAVCLLDEGYVWIEVYPDDENYAITIMYDDKNNLIEWYFDIAKEVGVENGIPYEDDLYLDLLIKPNGTSVILDEDELKDAFNNGIITKKDVDLAYYTLGKLQRKYVNNTNYLVELTREIYKFICKNGEEIS